MARWTNCLSCGTWARCIDDECERCANRGATVIPFPKTRDAVVVPMKPKGGAA